MLPVLTKDGASMEWFTGPEEVLASVAGPSMIFSSHGTKCSHLASTVAAFSKGASSAANKKSKGRQDVSLNLSCHYNNHLF